MKDRKSFIYQQRGEDLVTGTIIPLPQKSKGMDSGNIVEVESIGVNSMYKARNGRRGNQK
jgi:hypothetical protein